MKKVKRYSAGGYEDTDDYKNLVSAQEREDVEAIGDKFAKTMPKEEPTTEMAKPLKMASFKEAFAEARKNGEKTFEWMGKKYTTDLASEKKQAPKQVAPMKTGMQKRAEKQTAMRKSAPQSPGLMERFKSAMANPDNPRLRRERAEMAGTGYKKGGAVKSSGRRGDGIAQRGKTKGRMV